MGTIPSGESGRGEPPHHFFPRLGVRFVCVFCPFLLESASDSEPLQKGRGAPLKRTFSLIRALVRIPCARRALGLGSIEVFNVRLPHCDTSYGTLTESAEWIGRLRLQLNPSHPQPAAHLSVIDGRTEQRALCNAASVL